MFDIGKTGCTFGGDWCYVAQYGRDRGTANGKLQYAAVRRFIGKVELKSQIFYGIAVIIDVDLVQSILVEWKIVWPTVS